MRFLKRLFSLRRHKHDMNMEFVEGLAWLFVCKCGLETKSMGEAIELQGKVVWRCEP